MRILSVLGLLILFTLTSELSAQIGSPIRYGDVIHLQNGWNNYQGGYLDTRGFQKDFEKTGNHLCTSTALSPKREDRSGTWQIMSATGKKSGSAVLVGDQVFLQNMWKGQGGFLDTRGYQKDYEKTGNHLCVSTALTSNRSPGSGTWKISSATNSPAGTPVTEYSEIHLQNAWNNFTGGYLDTKGYQKDFEKTGNHLCTSTATVPNRSNGSGTWKVLMATKHFLSPGQNLRAGQRLTSKNGAYILRMQDDGNLCVYKFANGKQGTFVWGSMSQGTKKAKIIMQKDGNLVIYNGKKEAKWSSKTHPSDDPKFNDAKNKPVKCVLENDGTLKLYNAAKQVMWSSN